MLTDEKIRSLWDGHTVPAFGKTGINPIVFARAIEAEVRKDYEALIQQLVEALEAGLEEVIATGECEGVLFGPDQHVDEKLQAAIAAARARLKETAP